jgi:glucokinase
MTTEKFAVGVDLGATTVKTGLVAPNGAIVYQNKFPTNGWLGPQAVFAQIKISVDDALTHSPSTNISGIGIGAPGVVDNEGSVKSPPNIKDWHSVRLGNEIHQLFPTLRVEVENDANTAAIAEAKFGAGKQHPNFLFVIWGTGVGGGIILDKHLYRGPSGGAGEIGHISVDFNGPECNCGNRGCVEAYVGQRYLSNRTAQKLQSHPGSKILQLAEGNLTKIEPRIISQAAHDGDALAREILTEAGTLLGVALAGVMNTMDLRISIIGGGLSEAGDFVIRAIEESVRARVLKPLQPEIRVLQSLLGNNAGILGAAGLVL